MSQLIINLEGSKAKREEYLRDIFTQLCCQPASVIESETLEIKNWCTSEKQLGEKASDSAACLANAQGGCVLLGIENDDSRPQKFSKCPYPSVSVDWITQRIYDNTVPPVEIVVLDASNQLHDLCGKPYVNCFAIFVAKTKRESGHQTIGGLSKKRSGKECRPFYVAAPDDRTRTPILIPTFRALSSSSIAWGIQQHERKFSIPRGQWADQSEFLIHLGLLEPHFETDETPAPNFRTTLAGLLLFGTEEGLATARPGMETVVITPLETKRLTTNIVETYKYLCGSPSSLLPSFYPSFPLSSIREVVVNAFVHRSYRLESPIIIRATGEMLEIETPGGLPGELSIESLLYCTPVYRNFLLAEGARYLGICDKVGKGMDEIYRGILQQGLGFPVLENDGNHFNVRISMDRNGEFREFLKVRSQSLSQLDEIIVLRYLLDRESATFLELCSAMQRGHQSAKRILDEMVRKTMIENLDPLNLRWQLRPTVRADIVNIFEEAQYELGLQHLFGSE